MLVVDDEPTITEVVARYLNRAGYATRVAANGREALDAAATERPDLVVLDLMLPGIDGLEVMRRLRDQDRDRVAVILLTAKSEESDRVIGLRLGADDYVVKPFSPAELVARVDAVLRRFDTARAQEAPIELSDMTIDPTARQVFVRGQEVAAHPPRVRRAAVPGPPSRSGVLAQPVDGRGVAVLVLHRHLDGHGAHPPAAIQDRDRSRAAQAHPDRVGRRLPLPAMRLAAWIRARAGPLRRQFALVVAIVVAPVLVALVLGDALMVVSERGVAVVAAIVVGAGLIAIVAARMVAGGIMRDVESIRDGLMAVGRGQREVTIETAAHDELTELAAAANAMIHQLREEEVGRDQSEAARRDLIAAVSHDLRTPITSLRLLADAVGDDIVEDAETRAAYVRADGHPHRRAQRADRRPVRALAARGRRHQLDVEQVPLQELVGETVEAMRVQAEAKGVAVLAERARRP